MSQLHVIQEHVRLRVHEVTSTRHDWPCRKGCDECCRRLAAVPLVTRDEWNGIASALRAMPADQAKLLRERIRNSAGASRPVVCPLLDTVSKSCLVYQVRPVACRAYGFFVERQNVLGCSRIEAIAEQSPDVVWGNHPALEERLRLLGPAAELHYWLASERE